MEPWEALDLDDSDLSSLLRPCKRQRQPFAQTQFENSSPPSSLQSSSTLKLPPNPPVYEKTRDNSQSVDASSSPHQSPWASPSSPLPQEEILPAVLPKSCHLIPGAAGAIQAAMHRRNGEHNESSCGKDVEISTQEYIRRMEEDQGEEFMREPWLSAMDFLQLEGITNTTPLNEVKKRPGACKIDQVFLVVAIIKSCSRNGFGDLMVTLKDPSDSIDASIHRKVLNQKEFGRDVTVGSVLVLQKVVVFPPTRSARCLNVTLHNVVKVFAPVSQSSSD